MSTERAAAGQFVAASPVCKAGIDRLSAKVWGLTNAELREIQESLAELG